MNIESKRVNPINHYNSKFDYFCHLAMILFVILLKGSAEVRLIYF